MKLNKAITGLGALALLTSASVSMAKPQFTIDECAVAQAGVCTRDQQRLLEIDEIIGGYVETLTVNLVPGMTTSIETSGIFQFQGYENNDVPVANLLGAAPLPDFGFPGGYGLYALFQFEGDATLTLAGEVVFTATEATVEIYMDPSNDSSSTQDDIGDDFPTISDPSGDDELLAEANTLVDGGGVGRLGLPNGDFELILGDFTRTSFGDAFFIEPDPEFYFRLAVNGNFTDVDPLFVPGEGTYEITGNGSAFFVPEPNILALLATGMLGLGFVGRRRRKA